MVSPQQIDTDSGSESDTNETPLNLFGKSWSQPSLHGDIDSRDQPIRLLRKTQSPMLPVKDIFSPSNLKPTLPRKGSSSSRPKLPLKDNPSKNPSLPLKDSFSPSNLKPVLKTPKSTLFEKRISAPPIPPIRTASKKEELGSQEVNCFYICVYTSVDCN